MNNLLKFILLLLFGFYGFFQLYSFGQSDTEIEMEIYFFYMEICHGCDSFIRAEEVSGIVDRIVRQNNLVIGESLNIINKDNTIRMKYILEMKGLKRLSHVLPLLLIDDSFFAGYKEISEKLIELENR